MHRCDGIVPDRSKNRSIMDVLTFRDYCLSLPMAEETTPFDETTLVYKVGGKMFACADMAEFEWVAVKCDPAEAVLLREQYDEVSAALSASRFATPTCWCCGAA